MEPPYDGVAELWWRSRERIVGALADSAAQDAGAELLEDERTFIDLERSPLWLAHDYPQVNPTPEDVVARERSPIVKLFFCLRHPAGQTEDEAQRYWRTAHGPLIRSIAHAGGILRYLQVHRVEDELEAGLRQSRGTAVEPYTGHAELLVDRRGWGGAIPERARSGSSRSRTRRSSSTSSDRRCGSRRSECSSICAEPELGALSRAVTAGR